MFLFPTTYRTNVAERLRQRDTTAQALVRFPEESKKFITIFNYSKVNTEPKSNPNSKNTTKNYSPDTKNSQNNNATTSEKRLQINNNSPVITNKRDK